MIWVQLSCIYIIMPYFFFAAVILIKYLSLFSNSSGRLRAPSIQPTRMRW